MADVHHSTRWQALVNCGDNREITAWLSVLVPAHTSIVSQESIRLPDSAFMYECCHDYELCLAVCLKSQHNIAHNHGSTHT